MSTHPTPGHLTKDNIAAVIVTYFPDQHFIQPLHSVLPQVAQIIVVDNTVDDLIKTCLWDLNNKKITIIKNNLNLGVAAALNQGIRWAAHKVSICKPLRWGYRHFCLAGFTARRR